MASLRFWQEYDKIYKEDPLTANLFLLLYELADDNGQVIGYSEADLVRLMVSRFENPCFYARPNDTVN